MSIGSCRVSVTCGGRPSLVYEFRPHLGSNKLPMICRNFRRKIEALGGEYRFGCRLDGLTFNDQSTVGVYPPRLAISLHRMSSWRWDIVLAIRTRCCSSQVCRYVRKRFKLGLRIEHPQSLINARKYGRPEYLETLGAADYTLVAKGQPDLFTFCMCAGGVVIPSVSEPKHVLLQRDEQFASRHAVCQQRIGGHA